MDRYDCDVCLSAGSVNQWGYCEICGEEFEDPQSLVADSLDIWQNEGQGVAVDVKAKKTTADSVFVG